MSWFLTIAEALQYVPTPLGRGLRAAFYRRTLTHVGKGAQFHLGSIVTDRRARIGAPGWSLMERCAVFQHNHAGTR